VSGLSKVCELTLYGRPGCHLCDDMRVALGEFQLQFGFTLRDIDIDSDPALVERYGRLIPVLADPAGEICHYFLDPAALARAMAMLPDQAQGKG
jgi:hypothetical protein